MSVIDHSKAFWKAMLERNGPRMRELSDPSCMFVHIGTNADLDQEVKYYEDDIFHPTDIIIHDQKAYDHGDVQIVLTDVDYTLLLDGKETTHHFMVTEVWQGNSESYHLIQFSFTALVY